MIHCLFSVTFTDSDQTGRDFESEVSLPFLPRAGDRLTLNGISLLTVHSVEFDVASGCAHVELMQHPHHRDQFEHKCLVDAIPQYVAAGWKLAPGQ